MSNLENQSPTGSDIKLSKEQLMKLAGAFSESFMSPKITNDPVINWIVDLIMDGEWEDYDKELYEEEIEAFKALEEKSTPL